MTRTIFANGDSWTFGSEIAAPEFLAEPGKGVGMANRFTHEGADYLPSNDYYRIPRVWPSVLGGMLGDTEVINKAWPARSNDTIYRSTMEWLLTNYIASGKDTSDLTVIVGWSSLERKNVVFEDCLNDPKYHRCFCSITSKKIRGIKQIENEERQKDVERHK